MSHHYSGPNVGFPHGDARLDLTDLFAFPKPGEAGKSILVMDVHPSASISPLGPTTPEPFAPSALYELRIDTNGDLIADLAYQVRFTAPADGKQTATLRLLEGAPTAGREGKIIVEGAPVSTGKDAIVTPAGDYRLEALFRGNALNATGASRTVTMTVPSSR